MLLPRHQNSPLRGATVCDNHLPPLQVSGPVTGRFLRAAPCQGSLHSSQSVGVAHADKGKAGVYHFQQVVADQGPVCPGQLITLTLLPIDWPSSRFVLKKKKKRTVVLHSRSIMSQPWHLFL